MEQIAYPQLNVHRRFSPFEALINTNAFFQIKAAYITYNGDMYELKAMVRVRSDFRWHWLNDNYIDAEDAIEVVTKMIDIHASNFKEHKPFLDGARENLSSISKIENEGFSFFYEELM
ncbi:hypothetical protein [Vibrio harveyi]|uniref:hypothetical protein n=1 Tax=Vibrio harveyi TaxID=669 RepID=UPI003CF3D38A